MKSPKRLAVKLKAVAEKTVKKGHPWVFSDSITKLSPQGSSGDLVILYGQANNQAYAIGLYDPDSPIRVKIISRELVKINADFWKQQVQHAYAIRKPLLETPTNAYRLIFGENDGFPGLIVDVYDHTAVLKLYSAAWLPYLQNIVASISTTIQPLGIILRLSRNLQKMNIPYQEGQTLYGKLENEEVIFEEYGVRFKANLIQGHKTGFFLDHRDNRHRIGQLSKGKKVLDVFSYAGGFSTHALAGGATEAYSLDISAQALELAQENVRLNKHAGKHHIIAGDAFESLQKMISQNKKFDIVIIDPPSFAKSQKESAVAKKKYAELATLGARLTQRGGLLLLASCSSRVTLDEFREIHELEFKKGRIRYQIEHVSQHDIDHPITFDEAAYLKSIYYRILS